MPIDRLPARWQAPARGLRRWAFTDAPIFVVMAVIAVAYGIMYLCNANIPPHAHALEADRLVFIWGLVWLGVASACGYAAWFPCSKTAFITLLAWTALMLMWGLSLVAAWVWGDWDRGAASGTIHLILPVLIGWTMWRGHREEIVVKEVADAADTNAHRVTL